MTRCNLFKADNGYLYSAKKIKIRTETHPELALKIAHNKLIQKLTLKLIKNYDTGQNFSLDL
jgi:hypothetical protein